MMPGLPVSFIPQCKLNKHQGAYVELFQEIGLFEPKFIEAYQALMMICDIRLLKSQIMTCPFLDDIITSSSNVVKDCESEITVAI